MATPWATPSVEVQNLVTKAPLCHTRQIIEVGYYYCFKVTVAVWFYQISKALNFFNWREWPIIGEELR